MSAEGSAAGAGSFLALASTAAEAIARFDADCRYLYVNESLARAVARPASEVIGRQPADIGLSDEIMSLTRSCIARVLAGESPVTTRIMHASPGRAAMWYESRWVAECDSTGNVGSVLMVARDVTGQLQVAAALEESEVRFHAVFENVPFGMAVSAREAHGYATNANTMLASMLGYTRAELAQLHFSDFTHPDDVDVDRRLLEQVQRGERDGYAIEKRLVRKDGTVFWTYLKVAAARDDDGAIRYVVGLTEDITERKEIESELRSSEERFRALVEHSSDLIGILEMDGRVRYSSPSQRRLLGYADDEIRAMNALELVHPDDVARVRERMGLAMHVDSLPPQLPVRFRSRDGSWRALMVTLTNMHENPAVRGFVVNARDVTEELRLQEQLTHAQKMEALGQLAGGVAHDFNNILAAISGYAELLLVDLPPTGPAAEDVREIVRAASRGAGVTKQLLAFSRRQTLETEVLDLGSVVQETGRMLRALVPATIELQLPEPTGQPVLVRAARAQIEQIVMNLAVNARDAMPAGGVLRLRLETGRRDDKPVAVLVVSDSGTGMSDEVRARAFEPFFTTKPKGHGTGLGLATVYGLVRQFGGQVDLVTAPGAGTRFTIVLPLVEEAAAGGADAPAAAAVPLAGARILLAEDEQQLRVVLARALARAGYDVTTAGDGAAALATIHAAERPFALVISDIAMPRLGGYELAAAVDAGWPETPVMLMSGYAELGATPEDPTPLPPNVRCFIEKPFEVDRLLQLTAEVLASWEQRAE